MPDRRLTSTLFLTSKSTERKHYEKRQALIRDSQYKTDLSETNLQQGSIQQKVDRVINLAAPFITDNALILLTISNT